MKRFLAWILFCSLFLTMMPTALAADERATAAADELYALGLFKGAGTAADGEPIYELDRAPTRYEAVTMLVRLLGKDAEAQEGQWDMPFTDVTDWAKPYVGYAYAHGLTSGTGEATFSGGDQVTAAQYLTFVLRALGYESGKDFEWNAAWKLSDQLGLTSGEYNEKTNADFLRGHVALISRDALSVCLKGTSTKLLEVIPVLEEEKEGGTYEIDYSGAVPTETGGRTLNDSQLAALAGQTPEQAAASIATLADAYAWLEQEGYSTHGASISGNGSRTRYSVSNSTEDHKLSWSEMSTVINILLEGDYDDVGTLMCVLVADEQGWPFFYISFNYVKTGGQYYITDPVCHLKNSGRPFCRAYTIKLDRLETAVDALFEINAGFAPITIAAYPLHTGDLTAAFDAEVPAVTFEDVGELQYLFRATAADFSEYEAAKEQERADEMAAWDSKARHIDLSRFRIPSAIGTSTLTYDSAAALVGKEPELIADNVKTVADVLQYMIAARFGYYSDYFGTPWYGYWGFDAPGGDQIRENYGCCCGGYANAVSFLLQGDYEKVGTLRWIGGGNHTISWVYTEGQYYVFDFTQYCAGGEYDNYFCPVTVLDRLEDFYDQMPDVYSFFPKSDVLLMVAFEAGAAMYPSHWQDEPFTGLTFPKEAEGKITLIYQKDPRYGVQFKAVDTEIPGWNS